MKWILPPLAGLCLLGLVTSLTLCLLAWLGVVSDIDKFWLMHLLAMGVSVPAIFAMQHMARHAPARDLWKVALAGCPKWMRTSLWIIFGFAMVQFFPSLLLEKNEAAAFSGHWSVFFAVDFAIYYSLLRAPHLYRNRKCPEGHEVAPHFQFCPTCGRPVNPGG